MFETNTYLPCGYFKSMSYDLNNLKLQILCILESSFTAPLQILRSLFTCVSMWSTSVYPLNHTQPPTHPHTNTHIHPHPTHKHKHTSKLQYPYTWRIVNYCWSEHNKRKPFHEHASVVASSSFSKCPWSAYSRHLNSQTDNRRRPKPHRRLLFSPRCWCCDVQQLKLHFRPTNKDYDGPKCRVSAVYNQRK